MAHFLRTPPRDCLVRLISEVLYFSRIFCGDQFLALCSEELCHRPVVKALQIKTDLETVI